MQDYLGAIIVYIAILTSLITSYVLPEEASASLVALALQYTLLIPIYLNWVVKLFADIEMFFGACERISYCIENDDQEEQSMNACMFYIKSHFDFCFIFVAYRRTIDIARLIMATIWKHTILQRIIEASESE